MTTTVDYHDVRGNTRAKEAIRDHRRIEVGRMLLARTPIRVMASKLNVSTATVQKDIKVVERWWQSEQKATYAEQVARQAKILDELERAWLGRALYDEAAVDVLLRIMARRAKLLGLDKPTQTQLELVDDLDAARARALELVAGDLERRREISARAAQRDVIDVESREAM